MVDGPAVLVDENDRNYQPEDATSSGTNDWVCNTGVGPGFNVLERPRSQLSLGGEMGDLDELVR
jgi:hypothetical protein